MSKLAVRGGSPEISWKIDAYNSIGAEELAAATRTIRSGSLSKFLGSWHQDFYGGPRVQEFESAAANFFGVKHALTVNSWASGLTAAVGAIGIEPGDEVLVTPFTMAASATAVLHWNAFPVFVDIEPTSYCIDPDLIRRAITARTKAIMAVDIFGLPSSSTQLMAIAAEHDLKVITDSAQAPGAKVGDRFAGTLTDVGGFSLNYHKHINTGEGGIIVTDSDEIAENAALIRNHAEAVVGDMGKANIANMVGFNFRMGEIEASIGLEQLKKLESIVHSRQQLADRLNQGLASLPGLVLPTVPKSSTHSYYVYPITLQPDVIGVDRSTVVSALTAEGVPGLSEGYTNLHLLPMFQRKIAYGRQGFPWTFFPNGAAISYEKGICPVAESLHDDTLISIALCSFAFSERDIDGVVAAFHKVWGQLEELRR